MAVGIDQIHQLSYYIAAKQLTGYPSPAEWNSYAQLANIDLFNYYNDERDRLLLEVKSGQNLFVPEPLSNFIVQDYPMSSTSVNSYPPYLSPSLPADYFFSLAVKFQALNGSYNDVNRVQYQKLQNTLQSTIDNPTTTYPIFVEYSNNINIYPYNTPTPIVMTYIRYPVTPVWNYTIINGVPTYTSVGSVDFEFDSSETFRLLARILNYMGISIRDNELEQYAQQMTQIAS